MDPQLVREAIGLIFVFCFSFIFAAVMARIFKVNIWRDGGE